MNIKNIELSTDEESFIKLYAKPNLPLLGKKLGKDMGKYKALIEKLDGAKLAELENTGSMILDGVTFYPEEVLVFREAKVGTQAMSNRFISIDIDTNPDQALLNEGVAREMVSFIQKSRKDLNFNVSDRIHITFCGTTELSSISMDFKDYITSETLAIGLDQATSKQELECELENGKFSISLKKI